MHDSHVVYLLLYLHKVEAADDESADTDESGVGFKKIGTAIGEWFNYYSVVQRRRRNQDRTVPDHGQDHGQDHGSNRGSDHRSDYQSDQGKKYSRKLKSSNSLKFQNSQFCWANYARITTVSRTFYLVQLWY